MLVSHFLDHYCGISQRPLMSVAREAQEALAAYEWPGNVRELENVIERAVILEEGAVLTLDSLPDRVTAAPPPGRPSSSDSLVLPDDPDLAGTLEDVEREYMAKVLELTGWQKKRASHILGINSSTLYRKIQRYGLEPPKGRPQEAEAE